MYMHVFACNCVMYVGLQRNNPMDTTCIATCTDTCTYVECSHFAREDSMLYTENQSDEKGDVKRNHYTVLAEHIHDNRETQKSSIGR